MYHAQRVALQPFKFINTPHAFTAFGSKKRVRRISADPRRQVVYTGFLPSAKMILGYSIENDIGVGWFGLGYIPRSL